MTIWKKHEIDWLIENYPKVGKKFASKYLNKSESSIRIKTWRLGLKQDRTSDFFLDWQNRAALSKIGKKRPDQAIVIKRLHEDGKLKKTDKQKKLMSINRIKYIKENGHPKGFLGKKHKEESLKIISEKSKKSWNDPNFKLNSEEYRQMLSDRMVKLRAANKNMRSAYSRGRIGKRKDLNQYFRSSWEANYARYLNFLIKNKLIYKWEYEPDTFWFNEIKRGTRSYTPDFKVWEKENSDPYYIEIKGWMDKKSITKHKRMKKYYPNIKIIMIKKKEYNAIKRSISGIIPNWE